MRISILRLITCGLLSSFFIITASISSLTFLAMSSDLGNTSFKLSMIALCKSSSQIVGEFLQFLVPFFKRSVHLHTIFLFPFLDQVTLLYLAPHSPQITLPVRAYLELYLLGFLLLYRLARLFNSSCTISNISRETIPS